MSLDRPAVPGPMPAGFALTRLGRFAGRALAAESAWEVMAVFRRSFYCRSRGGAFVCVGAPSIGAGPLNALAALPDSLDWEACGLRPAAPAACDGQILRIDGRFAFSLATARAWVPASPPQNWQPASLARGLDLLAAEAATRAPRDGLGLLIPPLAGGCLPSALDAAASSPLAQAALGGLLPLLGWLEAAVAGAGAGAPALPAEAGTLIGLGTGLTPSGDDALGGVLIALRALGWPEPAERLAAWLLPLACGQTHAISRAHLACAAAGEGATALHEVLADLCAHAGADLPAGLAAIGTLGHTSGWDALAGVAAVARVAVRARRWAEPCGEAAAAEAGCPYP